MGNSHTLLENAARRPDQETLVRAAFNELDADHTNVLHGEELLQLQERWKRLQHHTLEVPEGISMTYEEFRELLVRDRALRLAHSWALLNRDVLRLIIAKLTEEEMLTMSRVCSTWYYEVRSPQHWSGYGGSVDEYLRNAHPELMVQQWFDSHKGHFSKTWAQDRYIEGFLSGECVLEASRKRGEFTLSYTFKCEPLIEGGETYHLHKKLHLSWCRAGDGSLLVQDSKGEPFNGASIYKNVNGELVFSVATCALQDFAIPWMERHRWKRQQERPQKQPPPRNPLYYQ